jgi:hypothetical protein
MQSRPNKPAKEKDRLGAPTRGSQPGRARVKGKRFSKEHQPKRPRGRPKGATNLLTRNLKEAILGGCADCGLDGKGAGGLRGYMKRLAIQDPKTMGTLVRSFIPMEVKVEEKQVHEPVYQTVEEAKAELARLGLPPAEIYKLEYYKAPLIDVEAVEST